MMDERSRGIEPAQMLHSIGRAAVPGCESVAAIRRLTAGANQETWAFDVVTPNGVLPLILRRAKGGTLQRATGIGLEVEAHILAAAGAAGVPTPEVVYVLGAEDGFGKGYVMRRIAGETLPHRILRGEDYAAARPLLAAQSGASLAAIHAVPTASAAGLASFTPLSRVEWLQEQYLATQQVNPVFSWAFAWLRHHAPPPPASPALVHGDFRHGNLMIGPEGIRAVLDWENAHIGDPAEDLGWLCVPSWRFGRLDQPVGGFGQRDELLAAYVAAGGVAPSPERWRFWEAYGSLYWGVVCARSVCEFRSGSDPSLERALIARRASECELDLLRLIAPRS
jgi:aminoglycoside phosphotransferase (APT) family kinase protein